MSTKNDHGRTASGAAQPKTLTKHALRVLSLAALAAGCSGGTEATESVAETSDALLGEISYQPANANGGTNPAFPAAGKPVVENMHRVGRIISTTDAYSSCVQEMLEQGVTNPCGTFVTEGPPGQPDIVETSTWGPYYAQPGDPYTTQITLRALADVRNPYEVSLRTDTTTEPNGVYARGAPLLQDGTPTIQEMLISGWYLEELIAGSPLVGKKEATQAEFFANNPAAVWHEATHQRGWQHQPGHYCGSVPYIIAECLGQVAADSQACTDVCPGDLRPVGNFDAEGCACAADPRLVHSLYLQTRNRWANPAELQLALDALKSGTTLAALEDELWRPRIPRTTAAITVNAFSSEPAWLAAPPHAIDTPVIAYQGTDSVYHTTPSSWRALYNDQYLYFYVSVVDPIRKQDNVPYDQHQDDSIEIYIDADGSGGTTYGANDFQLAFRPGDNTVYFGDNSATSTIAPTVASAERFDQSGYQFEVAIPWTMLGTTPDGTLGVEVHVNDDRDTDSDRDQQLAWATNSTDAWKSPALFTKVALPADVAPTSGGTITLDGIRNEPTWTQTNRPISRTLAPVASGNGTGVWRAFWTDSYLYVFVDVTDSASTSFENGNVWDDDSVEIYIDADNGHRGSYDGLDFQYVFRRNDPTKIYTGGASNQNKQGVAWGTRNVATGYTAEIAIPWGTLGVTPSESAILGFDVHINDDDNGGARDGKRSWRSTIDNNWQDTTTFGAIRLTGTTGTAAGMPFFYAATPPVIDGNAATDAAWNVWTGPPGDINKLIPGLGTVDTRAIWRGLWDYDNLYLHVEVMEAGQPFADSGDSWWQDDSVELFLDLAYRHAQTYNGEDEFHYIFRPFQTTYKGSASTTGLEGIEIASTSDGTGYTMEIKIPWAPNVTADPDPNGAWLGVGSVIGFDVHVNDDDGGAADREGKLTWALNPLSGDVSYLNPRTFGRITLAP